MCCDGIQQIRGTVCSVAFAQLLGNIVTKTIISLTTIPSRVQGLDRTIESFRAQTAEIDAIIVWMPRNYRRPEF